VRSVISASRRTDLPAFHLPWLLDAVRQGAADVESPFRAGQVRRVSLRPDDVAWFVFWSRNYRAWLRHRDAFGDYRVAFHFTITAGHPLLEPGVPSADEALRQAEGLARAYGGPRIFWRYDPIVVWQDADGVQTNHRQAVFARLCRELGALGVERCITSFACWYGKVRARMRRLGLVPIDPAPEEQCRVASELRDIAAAHGIAVAACCTADLLAVPGIVPAHCIDGDLLSRLGGEPVSAEAAPTREGCGCTKSVDIGSYAQRCGYDCLTCYASPSLRRFDSSDAASHT